jgi:hypothetical protein
MIIKPQKTIALAAAALLALGTSVFAADNGGKNEGKNNNNTKQDNTNMAGKKNSKSDKCSDDNNATQAGADCTMTPNAEQ